MAIRHNLNKIKGSMIRIAITMIAAFNFASASAQEIAEYGGTKGDLEKFIKEMRLDWRPAEQIDFTTGEKVRYGYWKRAPNTFPAGTVVHFNGRTEFIERNAYTYRDLTMR